MGARYRAVLSEDTEAVSIDSLLERFLSNRFGHDVHLAFQHLLEPLFQLVEPVEVIESSRTGFFATVHIQGMKAVMDSSWD
jgi:hypothetical protein